MDENNLPKTQPITEPRETVGLDSTTKSKIIKLTAALILAIGGVIFALDRLFTSWEPSTPIDSPSVEQPQENALEGTIKYVNPAEFPGENISYQLEDNDGNRLILLRSEDAKLEVAENMNAKVSGIRTKTATGESVLIVSELTVTGN